MYSPTNSTSYFSGSQIPQLLCISDTAVEGYGGKLQPLDLGWKECDKTLMSLSTDLPPDLLRMIRCNCHTDCSTI